MNRQRVRGCLEVAAIVVVGAAVGAFATSTLLRHVGGPAGGREPVPGAPAPMPPEARARIRIEVRNGSGVPGAAGRMTEFLRRQGFDVVDFGNSDRFDHPRTLVVDRIGDPLKAREVAAALQGVPIRVEPDSSLYLDLTVLVGADLEDVIRPPEVEGPGGWRGWLDRLPGR